MYHNCSFGAIKVCWMGSQLCCFNASLQLLLEPAGAAERGSFAVRCSQAGVQWAAPFTGRADPRSTSLGERPQEGAELLLCSSGCPSFPRAASGLVSIAPCQWTPACSPTASARFSLGRMHCCSDLSSKYLFPGWCPVNASFAFLSDSYSEKYFQILITKLYPLFRLKRNILV